MSFSPAENLDAGVLKYLRDVVGYNDQTLKEANSPYAVVQGVSVYETGSKVCIAAHADSRKQGKAIVINQQAGCT
jgi:hypothetical protein